MLYYLISLCFTYGGGVMLFAQEHKWLYESNRKIFDWSCLSSEETTCVVTSCGASFVWKSLGGIYMLPRRQDDSIRPIFWLLAFSLWYQDNWCVFFLQVLTCGFPPLEDRDKSLKQFAGHDFFGGGTFTKEETVSLLFPSYLEVVSHMCIIITKPEVCLVSNSNEIYLPYTYAIDQTGRDGEKSNQWHVCYTIWYLARQRGGNLKYQFLFFFFRPFL